MDIADHSPAGFQHAGAGPIGEVGGHALVRDQSWALPYQHAHQLTPGHVPDGVPRADPAIAYKNRRARVNAPQIQPVPDSFQTVHGVGHDGRRGKPVAHHQLDPGGARNRLPQLFPVFLVKASAKIRTGQIFVPVLTSGLQFRKPVPPGKIRVHRAEHRILCGGMIRPEAQHGQGLVPCPRLPAAQTGRGPFLQPPKACRIRRIFRQVQLPQIQFRHIRNKVPRMKSRILLLRFRNRRAVVPALDHRLIAHL